MGDFWDFLGHVLWNWLTLIAGVIIVIEPVARFLWSGYDPWAAKYLPQSRRRGLKLAGVLIAFGVANYLAFHDLKEQIRTLQARSGPFQGRHLEADQKERMRTALRLPSNLTYALDFNSVANCDECEIYAEELREFVRSIPGWKADGGVLTFPDTSAPREGLQLILDKNAPADLANRITAAFSSANIPLLIRPKEETKNIGLDAIIVVARSPK